MKKSTIFLFPILTGSILLLIASGLYAQVGITNTGSSITPQSMLQVHQNAASGQIFQLTNTTSRYTLPTHGFCIKLDPNFNVVFSNQYDNQSAGISFTTKSGSDQHRLTISNNGNVGIGHTSPGYKLTVSGPVALLETGFAQTYYTVLYSGDLSTNRFFTLPATYGTSGQVLTTDGAGMMNWSTASSLTTYENGLTLTGTTAKWGGALTGNTTITQSGTEAITFTNGGSGNITFNLASTGDFNVQANGTSKFFVADNGYIGIGNTAPDEELVIGSNLGSGWVVPALTIGSSTNGGIQIGNPTINMSISSGSIFGYSKIEANDASGNDDGNLVFEVDRIGIGNTTPGAKLHVENTGSEKTGYFAGTGTGLDDVTLMSENTSTGQGIAAYLKTYGTDVTLALGQNGNGPMLKCFGPNSGNEEFRIDGDGTTTLFTPSHSSSLILDPVNQALTVTGGNHPRINVYSATTQEYATFFLGEANTNYGMYWTYDGSADKLHLYGILAGTVYGPHVTVERESGEVGIGVTSPSSALDVKGNIKVRNSVGTVVMELGTGLDYAEGFDVSDETGIEPGTVLSIDPLNPGKLKICNQAYDKKVAGIVAGANGLGSGVRLGVEEYDFDVALAGRVYCNVDATKMAVEPGDLLTTSKTPGYAMKVADTDDAPGAILGKAMEGMEKGKKGQILVLVTLQ